MFRPVDPVGAAAYQQGQHGNESAATAIQLAAADQPRAAGRRRRVPRDTPRLRGV